VTDFELYFRARDGDEASFNTLYQRFSTKLFNYIYRIVLDRSLAEDLLQETFIRVIKSNLEERAKFSTWLYRVATNLCYKALRCRKISFQALDDSITSENDDPAAALERKINKDRITKSLARLPENQRVVIVLRFWEDMPFQEIAEFLSCPIGTVKSRTFYALENLKKFFNKEEP
jgi:RNA polymerase sigma-70 factor (ECF subfamily)